MTPESREVEWKAKCQRLLTANLEPSEFDYARALQACRFSPYSSITDAMLILNCGNWLTGEQLDAVVSKMLREGLVWPKAYGLFTINRRALPQEDSGYPLLLPEISANAKKPAAAPTSEQPPAEPQLSLF